ncbi:MAG: hypothetical protein KatS3mg051_1533 [Anaerolineae bacterium]|nr:MAG: hypothetical protein KatS3mg051_1533 [Anaerolineae bacterium]
MPYPIIEKYFLIKRERCARCGGTGYTQHPAWGSYWVEYAKRFPNGTTEAEKIIAFDNAFWRDEGYADPNRIPAEQEECPDCEGFGVIRAEVGLEEALMAVLPRALAEIDRLEQLALQEADAAAMLADFEPPGDHEREAIAKREQREARRPRYWMDGSGLIEPDGPEQPTDSVEDYLYSEASAARRERNWLRYWMILDELR